MGGVGRVLGATMMGYTEPYPALHGGYYGPAVPISPDPLVNYRWNFASLDAPLSYQVIHDCAAEVAGSPPEAFVNLSAMVACQGQATIVGAGEITLRFEAEAASWIEIDSDDLTDAAAASLLRVGISENRLHAPLEWGEPKRVGNSTTFRLQLNPQLYEGVRYSFVNISGPPAWPWRLSLRRVSQVLPTNYYGSFHSSDEYLTRLWWVGAYTTRATFVSMLDPTTNATVAYLGSILMNRGDRIAFLGDAHVAQATALAAFTNDTHALVNASLEYTSTGSGAGIEPYLLMWVNSVVDYFDASNDTAALLALAPAVEARLQVTASARLLAGDCEYHLLARNCECHLLAGDCDLSSACR